MNPSNSANAGNLFSLTRNSVYINNLPIHTFIFHLAMFTYWKIIKFYVLPWVLAEKACWIKRYTFCFYLLYILVSLLLSKYFKKYINLKFIFLFICYLHETEKQKQREILQPLVLQMHLTARAGLSLKYGARNSIWECHLSSRHQTTWAIISCPHRNKHISTKPGLEVGNLHSGTLIWEVGIPSCILTFNIKHLSQYTYFLIRYTKQLFQKHTTQKQLN